MVPKERINRPKFYFKVIRPRIIFSSHEGSFDLSFFSYFFFWFFLWFSISLGSFFNTFVLLLVIFIFFQLSELNTFWNSIYLHDCPSSSGIWSFIILEEYLSLPLPPNVEGDPWSGYWKRLSGSKGKLWNNFFLYQWMDERWLFFISNIVI